MRKFVAALLCAALLFPVIATPVAATGNCSRGYVRFWDGLFTGPSAKYCWNNVGGGDWDMEWDDDGPNLGPLYNGSYVYDFNSSNTSSGIGSMTFYDNPNDGYNSHMCMYYHRFNNAYATFAYASGNYDLRFGAIGSFYWTEVTSGTSCNGN